MYYLNGCDQNHSRQSIQLNNNTCDRDLFFEPTILNINKSWPYKAREIFFICPSKIQISLETSTLSFVSVHQNYIGVDGSREPYLLSVVQEGGAGLLRAILFNKMVSASATNWKINCPHHPFHFMSPMFIEVKLKSYRKVLKTFYTYLRILKTSFYLYFIPIVFIFEVK